MIGKVLPFRRHSQQNEVAAEWLVRRQSGAWTEADARAFSLWLAESEAHREAYEAAQTAWDAFNGVSGADIQRLSGGHQVRSSSVSWARYTAAAAVLIAVVVTGYWFSQADRAAEPTVAHRVEAGQSDATVPAEIAYETARGQSRQIALSDGSTVTLDTNSALVVGFTDGRRSMRLRHGRAYFTVAHDAARPFVVQAGEHTVTAVGTAFDVRYESETFRVVLVDGSVELKLSPDGPPQSMLLRPGQSVTVSRGAMPRLAGVDVNRATSWRSGLVQFDNTTIANAVGELNRYTDNPLIVGDPAVGEWRISGVFSTDDVEKFARAMTEIAPVQLQRGRDGSRILVRRGDERSAQDDQ